MSILSFILTASAFALLGVALSVTGCASAKIEEYKDNTPKVDIREYFNGEMVAYGTIHDFTGKVISRFTANIVGAWEGNKGTLDEKFVYDDGKTEERHWKFTVASDGTFTGTAGDVVGEAKGTQAGNTIFMEYVLKREVNGREMEFSMDDRLYLIDDTHLMNQTKMRKFGITVAELNIGFYKVKK
jgi:hypothetical protein